MLKINFQKVLYCLFIGIFFYAYFSSSDVIIKSVKDSLYLCYSTVVPALFIFMVFSFYISHTNSKIYIGLLFKPIFRLINIKNTNICSYIVLSLIGGFAVGGYFLSLIEKKYNVTKNALGVLSILMSNNSPAFIIMAVGTGIFNNFKLGVMLFLSITLSSLLTACIFSYIYSFSLEILEEVNDIEQSSFIQSITTSVKAMIDICGVIVVAFTACKVIGLYVTNQYVLLLLVSLTEVTTACVTSVELFGKNIYLVCAILALTPISAVLQLKSFSQRNISFKILLFSKLIHLPLSILIFKILINLFPYAAVVYSNTGNIVNAYWNSAPISVTLFVFCIVFVIFFDINIGIFTKVKK